MSRAALAAATALALLLLSAAPASAANDLVRPERLDQPPPNHRLTGQQAQRLADAVPKVIEVRRGHPGSYANVFLKGTTRWQVSYYSRGRDSREIAQVYVDDASGRVTEAWTGHQVAWTMARGYAGAFGRAVNSPLGSA